MDPRGSQQDDNALDTGPGKTTMVDVIISSVIFIHIFAFIFSVLSLLLIGVDNICLEHPPPLHPLGCVFLHLFCYFLRWQSSMFGTGLLSSHQIETFSNQLNI